MATGAGELFPYSDIDVLFLLPAEMNDDAREKVSELVGRLWDIGLEIGHSARSVEQCVAEGAQDVTVQTNLLEARFLAGSPTARTPVLRGNQAGAEPKGLLRGQAPRAATAAWAVQRHGLQPRTQR